MRRPIALATLLAALSVAPPTLHAQRPLTVGVAGGVSLPVGSFGDGADVGWHALAALALGSQMHPLGLRLDATYTTFPLGESDEARRITSVTLGPTYRLPSAGWAVAPYLLAAAGAYYLDCSDDALCDGTTRFGWNAGLGMRARGLGLHGFLEARYHRIAFRGDAVQWAPVTVGLLF
ncbi:MAG TPA: hypothetical protein VEA99_01815 [Gemmatimonadaceae bacterium]|nr:hypothetical protein [Gemmatimonadaceae bacterium]